MAIEPRRGCGYRKVGGLYLVSGRLAEVCHRLPFPLTVCPTCAAGVKQARGWTWVDGVALLGGACATITEHGRTFAGDPFSPTTHCGRCAVCFPLKLGVDGRCGLVWVGARFYPTPADFEREAGALGVSRRVSAIPRDFVVGRTVLLAHPYAVLPATRTVAAALVGAGDDAPNLPGIFHAFLPERVEQLVRQSEATAERYAEAEKRGITLVVVPDGDPDHEGSVYDKPDAFDPDEEPPVNDEPPPDYGPHEGAVIREEP